MLKNFINLNDINLDKFKLNNVDKLSSENTKLFITAVYYHSVFVSK
jgi:hypothetical protein